MMVMTPQTGNLFATIVRIKGSRCYHFYTALHFQLAYHNLPSLYLKRPLHCDSCVTLLLLTRLCGAGAKAETTCTCLALLHLNLA